MIDTSQNVLPKSECCADELTKPAQTQHQETSAGAENPTSKEQDVEPDVFSTPEAIRPSPSRSDYGKSKEIAVSDNLKIEAGIKDPEQASSPSVATHCKTDSEAQQKAAEDADSNKALLETAIQKTTVVTLNFTTMQMIHTDSKKSAGTMADDLVSISLIKR